MKKKNKFIVLFLFVYFLFSFTINKFHKTHMMLNYVLPIIFIVFNYRKLLYGFSDIEKVKMKKIVFLYFIVVSWSIIYPLIKNTNDFTYSNTLLSVVRNAIKFLFLSLVLIKYYDEETNIWLFIDYFIKASVIYVFSTLLFSMVPSLKEFWSSFIYETERNRMLLQQPTYMMRFGIAGFSGFQQTFIMSIASAFSACVILKKVDDNVLTHTDVAYQIILLFGNTFYGRVGLIATFLIIMFLIIKLSLTSKRYLWWSVGIVTFVSILLWIIYLLVPKLRVWYIWAFALGFNFFRYGQIGTGSSKFMFETMFIKMKPLTFLLGDGKYTVMKEGRLSYYMSTDIGYIRPILFYGVIFTFILIFLMFYIMLETYKSTAIEDKKYVKILMIMITFIYLFFELKGEIIFRVIPIVFNLYLITIYSNKKGDNKC